MANHDAHAQAQAQVAATFYFLSIYHGASDLSPNYTTVVIKPYLVAFSRRQ